jgi:hypothetical protein
MDASDLTKRLLSAAEAGPSTLTEEERKQLLAACGKLHDSLENPMEAAQGVMLAVV